MADSRTQVLAARRVFAVGIRGLSGRRVGWEDNGRYSCSWPSSGKQETHAPLVKNKSASAAVKPKSAAAGWPKSRTCHGVVLDVGAEVSGKVGGEVVQKVPPEVWGELPQ